MGEGRERRLRLSPEIQGVLRKALAKWVLDWIHGYERRYAKELKAYETADMDADDYWDKMRAVTNPVEDEVKEVQEALGILKRLEREGTGRPWIPYWGLHERSTRKELKGRLGKILGPGKRAR